MGRSFVAAGEAARYDHGPDTASTRFALASQWWTELTTGAEIRDELKRPGTGLVCMEAHFLFANLPGRDRVACALIVPQVVVRLRRRGHWLACQTSIATSSTALTRTTPRSADAPPSAITGGLPQPRRGACRRRRCGGLPGQSGHIQERINAGGGA